MSDHSHLTASKDRKDGTTDQHRFTVATEQVDAEKAIAIEMGYRVRVELCYGDCLKPNVKS